MFVGEFQNGLIERHFNEFMTYKLTLLLTLVVTRVECYTEGEERNTKKKASSVKEHVSNSKSSHPHKKSNYTSPIKEDIAFKKVDKVTKNFTPPYLQYEQIWRNVLHLHNIHTLPHSEGRCN